MAGADQENLDRAFQHRQAGRMAEAEQLYRGILEHQPNHAVALHELGVLICETGRADSGMEFIRRAIAQRPDFPDAYYNLGVALTENGLQEEAIAAYRKAVAIKPDFAAGFYNLAAALSVRGHIEEAISNYQRAVALHPKYAEAYCNLGILLMRKGKVDDAIAACQTAIAVRPQFAEARRNLGIALLKQGRTADAISAFRQAIEIKPDFAEACYSLGDALTSVGTPDEIIAAFRQCIAINPRYAEAHLNLGIALSVKGEHDQAIAAFRQAVAVQPNYAEAHYNLGVALMNQNRPKEAITAYQKAIALKPGFAEAHYNLGVALKQRGRLDEAIAAYRQAIAFKPNYPQALNNLAIALMDSGQVSECIAAYRQAIAIKPDYNDAHSNMLLALHYSPDSDAASLLEAHRHWAQAHAEPLEKLARTVVTDRKSDRRLRIGYVSGDFWNHAAARFVMPLLANHDRSGFEIFCYANISRPDEFTGQIRRNVDGWRNIFGVSDEQVAAMVREDRIDILVDLSLHTSGNRLLVFARKPAPVQATWLGYASTTGMRAIDWRLTDPHIDPVGSDQGQNDRWYSEKSIRLPCCFWCYAPLHHAGEVHPLRAIETGRITFASFNRFEKVSVPAQELWAAMMSQIPDSRLAIHAHVGAHRTAMLERFANHGVQADRIEFVGRLPLLDYLRRYNKVDIALDPFPFGGGTTSCDALWMGVPLLTLRGKTAVGRGGASILSNVGLDDWIAETPGQYIEIARTKAADLPKLALLRSSLRDRMRQSPLMDAPRFARDMESAYREMWRSWCGSSPPIGAGPTQLLFVRG